MLTRNNENLFLLFIFNVMLCCVCFSQTAPAIEWQNTIGGNQYDELYSIDQTVDGGYILGGKSNSNISGDKLENRIGDYDYWIVKTNSTGNIQWQNTLGGFSTDQLYAIHQTTDGGYILGGWSSSNSAGDKSENSLGLTDYWLIKTDSLGNKQWQNTIGGNGLDYFQSILQTNDGGYIIGGYSNSNISGDKTENNIDTTLQTSDYWIVKTDSIGNIQWQNTLGGSGDDLLYAAHQTSDGGFILGGKSNSTISGDKTESSNGGSDYWIIKTDSMGIIQWQNTIGGNDEDNLHSITQTTDGGFIIGGFSRSNISGDKQENSIGGYDYWIIKTNPTGNIQWQNTIGGSFADQLYTIHQTKDGGYILGGYSVSNTSGDKSENSYGPYWDYWIVKTDIAGNILWDNTIGGNGDDGLYSMQQTDDGGYLLGGWSWSNISGDKTENCIGPFNQTDYWIIKLFPDTITSTFNLQNTTNNIQLYPNPTKEEVTITTLQTAIGATLKVYNVYGHVVFEKQITTTNIRLQTTTWLSGVYFISINNQTQKLIKL